MELEVILGIIAMVLAVLLVGVFIFAQHVPEPVFECWDGSMVSDPSECPTNPLSLEGLVGGVNDWFAGFGESVSDTVCRPYEIFGVVIDLC